MSSRCRFTLLCIGLVLAADHCVAEEPVEFNRDIRPILARNCLHCHGADEATREADLRLDILDGKIGPFASRTDDSKVLDAGHPDSSLLWQRIATDDADLLMPPTDSELSPLSKEELETVKKWIEQGAKYEQHWAFSPLQLEDEAIALDHDKVQTLGLTSWLDHLIDRRVLASLFAKEQTPKAEASKRTLIRRLSLDLTGLPPTLEEIGQFLSDESESALGDLVDRLMASPRYGEHMAKYWLDLVRFADTNGIHHDHYREMTPYRDWVIRSFNDNLPFDQFVIDQIAGDLPPEPTTDQLIASGFNRLHLVIDKGTAIPEESFNRNVVDRVTAVGTAFLGLTVGCAACHDHKYDPISQKDFYQLYAFFNNIDSGPETPGRNVHAPSVQLPSPEQKRQLDALRTEQREVNQVHDEKAKELDKQLALLAREAPNTEESKTAARELKTQLKQLNEEHEQATAKFKERKTKLDALIPVSLVMKEREEERPAHILIRGAYDQPGERVFRNTPAFLPPLKAASADNKTRMDLALWLVDSSHPLTARVTVNRFWQQFFGIGLVKTSEDFGTQGELPSHPELLDELTLDFVNSGWDVKELVRKIVTSRTYRQESAASREDYEADPENRMLARGSRFRMDAEMIRDQLLSVTGKLNTTMYGKSVRPPQPPDLWKSVSMVSSSTYAFEADSGDKIYRRSLYTFWKRALPPPQMTIFDAPTRESCIARRERTNTPLQALVLMNEENYFAAAKHYATAIAQQEFPSDSERIIRLYESVTAHRPDAVELESMLSTLEELRAMYQDTPSLTEALFPDNVSSVPQNAKPTIAAYAVLINAIFNLDIAKTRQ